MMGATEVKAEKLPPEDSPNAVLILTGEDFDSGIEKGLAFVKFFAPWYDFLISLRKLLNYFCFVNIKAVT